MASVSFLIIIFLSSLKDIVVQPSQSYLSHNTKLNSMIIFWHKKTFYCYFILWYNFHRAKATTVRITWWEIAGYVHVTDLIKHKINSDRKNAYKLVILFVARKVLHTFTCWYFQKYQSWFSVNYIDYITCNKKLSDNYLQTQNMNQSSCGLY
jgi:hypothetical protein